MRKYFMMVFSAAVVSALASTPAYAGCGSVVASAVRSHSQSMSKLLGSLISQETLNSTQLKTAISAVAGSNSNAITQALQRQAAIDAEKERLKIIEEAKADINKHNSDASMRPQGPCSGGEADALYAATLVQRSDAETMQMLNRHLAGGRFTSEKTQREAMSQTAKGTAQFIPDPSGGVWSEEARIAWSNFKTIIFPEPPLKSDVDLSSLSTKEKQRLMIDKTRAETGITLGKVPFDLWESNHTATVGIDAYLQAVEKFGQKLPVITTYVVDEKTGQIKVENGEPVVKEQSEVKAGQAVSVEAIITLMLDRYNTKVWSEQMYNAGANEDALLKEMLAARALNNIMMNDLRKSLALVAMYQGRDFVNTVGSEDTISRVNGGAVQTNSEEE